MSTSEDSCLFLVAPVPGADRSARDHLRPWLAAQGLIHEEIHDVLTAVTEAVDSVVAAEHREGHVEPVQVSAVVDLDRHGARGIALRVVDRGTVAIEPGDVSDQVDYGQIMMHSAMDDVVTRRDPEGGTVIAMRTRPLRRRPTGGSAGR